MLLLKTGFSRRLLLGLAVLGGLWAAPALADDFLAPEQAFAFSAKAVDAYTVRLHWDIAPGYHLYRERIGVQSDAPAAKWEPLMLPAGKDEFDANFNKTVAVYRQALDVDMRLTQGSAAVPITVNWQGCADSGLCYQPTSAQLQVALTGLGATQNSVTQATPAADDAAPAPAPAAPAATSASAAKSAPAPAVAKTSSEAPDSIASTLASGSLLRTMGVF